MPNPLSTALVASILGLFCMNTTQADMEQSVKNLKVVDAALEVNDFARAQQWLDWTYGYINDVARGPGPDGYAPPPPGHLRRAARAKALLLSRHPRSTAAQREQAQKIYEKEVGAPTAANPASQADYAEILSRIPAQSGPATAILRALRDKDLMGSAHGFEALAELEKAAGDSGAEAAAREKCKTRAKSPKVCEPAPLPPPTPPAPPPKPPGT